MPYHKIICLEAENFALKSCLITMRDDSKFQSNPAILLPDVMAWGLHNICQYCNIIMVWCYAIIMKRPQFLCKNSTWPLCVYFISRFPLRFLEPDMSRTQNGCHFADYIFKYFFLYENFWSSNIISLKYVPYGLIDNKPALGQINDGRWISGSHYLNQCWLNLLTHMCHSASVIWCNFPIHLCKYLCKH